MKVDFDVSGWSKDRTYEKFDVVFFSGDPETGCNPFESGYYYATASSNGGTNSTLAPTGVSAKWTRSFPSTPSYNSSVSFEAKTFKNFFGNGYYSIVPKSHNNLAINYNLNFNGRTEKESKAILHFLSHKAEEPYTGAGSGIVGALPSNATIYQGEEVLTGFNFTPFEPYNQTGRYFCDTFDHEESFPNVHNIAANFSNENASLTNWMSQVIPFDNTAKYWAAGETYNKFDIVYYSGHNISNHSGYYYNSGDSDEVTATTSNGPEGANTLWTKNVFYFNPSSFSIPQEPRILKSDLNRDYVKRWNDGINTNLLNVNLSFEGKSEAEAKAITHFLVNKKGYESFKFSPPKPYDQDNKFFVCQNWTDSFIFSDNRSISTKFAETPIDSKKVYENFKTYILDTHGKPVAPLADTSSVHEINFGIFMTGFHSGTGFYLLNSGDIKTISTLSLTGEHARSGVYKFKRNTDPRITIDGGNSATFELDRKESGFFEVEFSTTGKSGARNSWFTNDLDTDGYFYYFSGHGGAGYSAPAGYDGFPRPSQITVTTKSVFGTSDPSGVLKINLTGNAEALDPGAIGKFRVGETTSDLLDNFITGYWTYTEPLTATGIILEVSGSAPTAVDPHGATGILVDEPTGTTGFSYLAYPGRPRYFRIRTQNIDLIGGNIHGGEARTVNYTDWAQASATTTNTALNVFVMSPNFLKVNRIAGVGDVSSAQRNFIRSNINLRTEAEKELDRLQAINPEITIDVFSKIRFIFGPNLTVYSADTNVPAVTTSTKFTSDYGGGLDPVPIQVYIPKTTSIIGAGGKGGNVDSARIYAGETPPNPRLQCPVSYTVDASQKSALSSAQVRLGSLPELTSEYLIQQAPVSSRYLSGKMDGSYIVGNAPGNGEDGGTALEIHSDYASSTVDIYNNGFIGGGGGGGGAGGTRTSNLIGLKIEEPHFALGDNLTSRGSSRLLPYFRKMDSNLFGTKVRDYFRSLLRDPETNETTMGMTYPQPSLQNRVIATNEVPDFQNDKVLDVNKDGWQDDTVVFEARPGGGGGGGAGFRESTYEFSKDNNTYADSRIFQAQGGSHGMPFLSPMNVHGNRTIEVNIKSNPGKPASVQMPLTVQSKVYAGGMGGLGAASPLGENYKFTDQTYYMHNPSGLTFSHPSTIASMRNDGGAGGLGGGFGQDGRNGYHPIQNYSTRYINAQYGPEPRNFGFGGTGGLCIDANGAILNFIGGHIPNSGFDNKTEQDNKNSELYRNKYASRGRYLTPKYKSATTIETSGHHTIGYISGLKGTLNADGSEGDTINFDGVNKKLNNQSNAVNGSYPAWKAFNQVVKGNFDNYMLMDQGSFPYYIIYDFGVNNKKKVYTYTITSAGASPEYYSDSTYKQIFGEVFSPTHWKLFGSNASSDVLLRDSDMTLLDERRHESKMPKLQPVQEGASVLDANFLQDKDLQDDLETAQGDKHNSYVCVPGALRDFIVGKPGVYRYYIFKILSADGNQGKVKIADLAFRDINTNYAGFIKI